MITTTCGCTSIGASPNSSKLDGHFTLICSKTDQILSFSVLNSAFAAIRSSKSSRQIKKSEKLPCPACIVAKIDFTSRRCSPLAEASMEGDNRSIAALIPDSQFPPPSAWRTPFNSSKRIFRSTIVLVFTVRSFEQPKSGLLRGC